MALAIRTPDNADLICTLVAGGWSLRQIALQLGCKDGSAQIHQWRHDDPAFAARYESAKIAQMDHFAEELTEIADDASNDWMERERDGKVETVANVEHIARSRLRVDTRKWLMAKMAPKRFGEKQQHEITGPGGRDLIVDADPARLRLALEAVIARSERRRLEQLPVLLPEDDVT